MDTPSPAKSLDLPANGPIPGRSGDPHRRVLVVSVPHRAEELPSEVGRSHYSYRFVYEAFAPLLARWGTVQEITRPESRLDYAVWKARQQGCQAYYLGFTPMHTAYVSPRVTCIGYPFWEFPDIPAVNLHNNPRNNWARVAEHFQLLLSACNFTRDAFAKAGVKTPVHVLPVPINSDYFRLPPWKKGQKVVLETPSYVCPQNDETPGPQSPWVDERLQVGKLDRFRHAYRDAIRSRLPKRVDRWMTYVFRTAYMYRRVQAEDTKIAATASSQLDLEGVVYTTVLNPFDERKNWCDLLSAYLCALADCPDALLVVKLVLPATLMIPGMNGVLSRYRQMGLSHRCRIAFVPAYLTSAQMFELARGSTYYVNASFAEGACLPLQDFLAAGRPGIAPVHSAMADYFDAEVGFTIEAHAEPAAWLHDPSGRYSTTWQRPVWESLFNQFRASYAVAKQNPARHAALGDQGRQRMNQYASSDKVWPLLCAALDSVAAREKQTPSAAQEQIRLAS